MTVRKSSVWKPKWSAKDKEQIDALVIEIGQRAFVEDQLHAPKRRTRSRASSAVKRGFGSARRRRTSAI